MKTKLKRICVNCGSSPGFNPAYTEAAAGLGRELAARGIELVYGGGYVGLMGEVAETVMKAGGKVTGIIPKSFSHKVPHINLTKLHIDLLLFLDHAVSEGFLKKEHKDMLIVGNSAGEILDLFETYEAPVVEKWVGRKKSEITDSCM
jgi:predicted Rossmann-fold nucleotide-binding protein